MTLTQKVNVFVEYGNGKTSYQSGIFSREKTIEEIMHHYGLPMIGVHVYANSNRVWPERSLNDMATGPVCFLSFTYGDTELPKRKIMTIT